MASSSLLPEPICQAPRELAHSGEFRTVQPVFGQVSFTAPANAGGGVPQDTYNIVGRIDYNLNGKTQMFFRYVNYDEVDESGGIFASPVPAI